MAAAGPATRTAGAADLAQPLIKDAAAAAGIELNRHGDIALGKPGAGRIADRRVGLTAGGTGCDVERGAAAAGVDPGIAVARAQVLVRRIANILVESAGTAGLSGGARQNRATAAAVAARRAKVAIATGGLAAVAYGRAALAGAAGLTGLARKRSATAAGVPREGIGHIAEDRVEVGWVASKRKGAAAGLARHTAGYSAATATVVGQRIVDTDLTTRGRGVAGPLTRAAAAGITEYLREQLATTAGVRGIANALGRANTRTGEDAVAADAARGTDQTSGDHAGTAGVRVVEVHFATIRPVAVAIGKVPRAGVDTANAGGTDLVRVREVADCATSAAVVLVGRKRNAVVRATIAVFIRIIAEFGSTWVDGVVGRCAVRPQAARAHPVTVPVLIGAACAKAVVGLTDGGNGTVTVSAAAGEALGAAVVGKAGHLAEVRATRGLAEAGAAVGVGGAAAAVAIVGCGAEVAIRASCTRGYGTKRGTAIATIGREKLRANLRAVRSKGPAEAALTIAIGHADDAAGACSWLRCVGGAGVGGVDRGVGPRIDRGVDARVGVFGNIARNTLTIHALTDGAGREGGALIGWGGLLLGLFTATHQGEHRDQTKTEELTHERLRGEASPAGASRRGAGGPRVAVPSQKAESPPEGAGFVGAGFVA